MSGHHQPPINRVSAMLAWVERALSFVACVAMAAIMLIVVLDVALRYLLGAPLSWSYNLIGLYLMVAVFFLALSDTLHHHGHIAIDILQHHIPYRLRNVLLSVSYALSSLILALCTQQAGLRFLSAYVNDDRIAAIIPWPTWIAYLIVTVGCGAITLRCAYRAVGHLASAWLGRDVVEMPPPPVTQRSIQEGAQ